LFKSGCCESKWIARERTCKKSSCHTQRVEKKRCTQRRGMQRGYQCETPRLTMQEMNDQQAHRIAKKGCSMIVWWRGRRMWYESKMKSHIIHKYPNPLRVTVHTNQVILIGIRTEVSRHFNVIK
jgi:hypothetical protein